MINADDIIDMSSLTREEIAAIAEHEHVATLTAALVGEYEMHLHNGPAHVQRMICDDIKDALHNGDRAHAKELYATLHHFMADHPEAARGAH
ncbi:MAG: hypothetical protein AAGF48_15355 [Pseudomonadota bacterium]